MTDTQQSTISMIIKDGLLQSADMCESPNQDSRPDTCAPELVVIHGISLPPGEYGGSYVEQFFSNRLDWDAHPYFSTIRGMTVSAHILIRRDGHVLQFVPFHRRAWHAGASSFRGRPNCNDYSIGIELEGCDETAYTDAQYACLIAVLHALHGAYSGLNARCIAGHCDIAPGRKSDPGPAFDWLRLYDGLSAPQSAATR